MVLPPILQTKITPPSIQQRTLARPRVCSLLTEALNYRLTLLQAGAGYGKSTSLAVVSQEVEYVVWYQVAEEDRDPLVFLQHLFYATQRGLPDIQGLPLQVLESWDVTHGQLSLNAIIDHYLNVLTIGWDSPFLLIIDDVHLILATEDIAQLLDRLVGLGPPELHILLSARSKLQLPNLSRLQNRGEVLTLDQSILAFTADEINALFSDIYGYDLSPEEAVTLLEVTEGWAIALQLIWQGLRTRTIDSIETALALQASSLERLFEVLAQEVFEQQPQDIQDFMKQSATLRVMTPAACNALQGTNNSQAMLTYLRRQELFVVDVGDGSLRYHHIFHRFLRQMTAAAQMQEWHQKAASFYTDQIDYVSAIYHFLRAEDYAGSAQLLDSFGQELLAMGRLKTLASYLDELPPETLHQYPTLLSYMGDLARLHSRFQEALAWYQQAETLWQERGNPVGVGRALRGQARVHLDTVSPNKAEELLQQALRMSDGTADREAQARLYELLAENKLNSGNPAEAEVLRQQAEALRREGPADSQLLIRVQLRTGRLAAACRKLEELAETESQEPVQTPRSHRETQLLLSIIYAMQGRPEDALQAALEGTRRGEQFNSPFVTAVGHMRQGHALMLLGGPDRFATAHQQFEQAVEISRSLAVPRLRIEACWGLCQTYGRQGDLRAAQQVAQEGIEIATQVGDEWIASLIRLAMGVNHILVKDYEVAAEWLNQASRGFDECSDPFGAATARLWLCLGWFDQGDFDRLSQTFSDVLAVCQQHGYDYLFTRPTLLGSFDERVFVPVLIHARINGWQGTYPAKLLGNLGLADIRYHPGYQLRIETLGAFQVWRGDLLIPYNGWRREKTRQLFQLLITYRDTPLDRDQFCEYLWPGAEPETAQRNFKVALSTLYNVLEPGRAPGSESAYVLREGTVYGLRPGADISLDVDQFKAAIAATKNGPAVDPDRTVENLSRALDFYRGEYLPDTRYETWAAMEREHLAVYFLQTADYACEIYLKQNAFQAVIDLCQRILAQDNCWERAYRYLMTAYHHLGDHGQIARTYQQCTDTLQAELDVSPAPETITLFQQLTS